MRVLAFDQAHCADYFETICAGRFNGLDRRSPSCADVVNDNNPRAGLTEALDTLASPMLLLGFTNQEAMQRAAGDGDCDDNGVRAHRQSADGGRFPALLANFLQK